MRRLLLAAVVEAVLAALASGSEPPPVRQPPPVKAPAPPQAPPARVAAESPKPKRVRMAGYWWDDLGDGTYRWCTPCNGPYPAGGVPGMILVRP